MNKLTLINNPKNEKRKKKNIHQKKQEFNKRKRKVYTVKSADNNSNKSSFITRYC